MPEERKKKAEEAAEAKKLAAQEGANRFSEVKDIITLNSQEAVNRFSDKVKDIRALNYQNDVLPVVNVVTNYVSTALTQPFIRGAQNFLPAALTYYLPQQTMVFPQQSYIVAPSATIPVCSSSSSVIPSMVNINGHPVAVLQQSSISPRVAQYLPKTTLPKLSIGCLMIAPPVVSPHLQMSAPKIDAFTPGPLTVVPQTETRLPEIPPNRVMIEPTLTPFYEPSCSKDEGKALQIQCNKNLKKPRQKLKSMKMKTCKERFKKTPYNRRRPLKSTTTNHFNLKIPEKCSSKTDGEFTPTDLSPPAFPNAESFSEFSAFSQDDSSLNSEWLNTNEDVTTCTNQKDYTSSEELLPFPIPDEDVQRMDHPWRESVPSSNAINSFTGLLRNMIPSFLNDTIDNAHDIFSDIRSVQPQDINSISMLGNDEDAEALDLFLSSPREATGILH